ncbi:hypothetical protein [Ekhidna sp.]
MKYSLSSIAFLICLLNLSAQDGISIGRPSPDPSAILHVDAPEGDKGMLIPRLTTLQRDNIITTTTPANGLIIYNTDQQAFNYYDGSSWVRLIPTPAKFNIDMASNRITDLGNGINPLDAVNKGQLDTSISNVDASNLNRSGNEAMTGNLNVGNNRVVNLSDGVNDTDAATKGQLDAEIESIELPELFTTTGGSGSFIGGVRWTIIDTGNSDSKRVDITAWSDVAGGLIRIQIRSGATSPANSTSNNLLIQRNFQPSVGAPTVSQESMEFGVFNTTDRYFHIRVQPENGATVGYYGLKVRVRKL